MKATLTLMLAGALLLAACKPEEKEQPAQPSEPATETPAAAAVAPKAPQTVPEALESMVTINGKPSTDAQYYIYLQSASWCPPCRKEMPEIVKAYPEMKKNGVELILIGCDENLPGTQRYLEEFSAGFPAVHYTDEDLRTLPGFSPATGIPDATFVDRQGHVLLRGSGALIKDWKRIFHKGEDAPSAAQAAQESAASEAAAESAVPSL